MQLYYEIFSSIRENGYLSPYICNLGFVFQITFFWWIECMNLFSKTTCCIRISICFYCKHIILILLHVSYWKFNMHRISNWTNSRFEIQKYWFIRNMSHFIENRRNLWGSLFSMAFYACNLCIFVTHFGILYMPYQDVLEYKLLPIK